MVTVEHNRIDETISCLIGRSSHRKPFILSMAQFNGKEWLFWLRNISNANVDIFHSQRVSKRINLDELDDCDYVNNDFSQSQGIFEALPIAYSFVSNKKKISNVNVLERIPTDSFGQDGKPIYYLDKTGEIIEPKLINDAVLRACFNFSDGQNEHWQFHYDGTTRDGILFLLTIKVDVDTAMVFDVQADVVDRG